MPLDPEKRGRLEPGRMESTFKALVDKQWTVTAGPDGKSYRLVSPAGAKFVFWPYSGWFSGKTAKGRGFGKLMEASEV